MAARLGKRFAEHRTVVFGSTDRTAALESARSASGSHRVFTGGGHRKAPPACQGGETGADEIWIEGAAITPIDHQIEVLPG